MIIGKGLDESLDLWEEWAERSGVNDDPKTPALNKIRSLLVAVIIKCEEDGILYSDAERLFIDKLFAECDVIEAKRERKRMDR